MRRPLKAIASLSILIALPGCKSSSDTQVEFSARQPDSAEVAEAVKQDKETISGYKPDGLAERVYQSYLRFNRAAVHMRAEPLTIDQAMHDLKLASRRCLEDQGQEPLRKLALFLLDRFEQDLTELVRASREPGAAVALLTGAPPPVQVQPVYKKFTDVGGNFLLHAANAGLVRQSKNGGIELAKGASFFMRLAFKVRWANVLPEATRPMDWLLTDFERKWYDIWVVERSRTASLQRKLESIDRLARIDPAYPADTARGIVLYQKKRFAEAIESFESALSAQPEDKRIESFLTAAKSRAD